VAYRPGLAVAIRRQGVSAAAPGASDRAKMRSRSPGCPPSPGV